MWGPVAAVLDEWGPPRECGELNDMPKRFTELLAVTTVGKKKPDNMVVAAVLGWPLLSLLRKDIDAELAAKTKVRHLGEEVKQERNARLAQTEVAVIRLWAQNGKLETLASHVR